VRVELSPAEMMLAAWVGGVRRVEGIRKGRTEHASAPLAERWRRDIEGAGGELATAKHLNLYWSGALGQLFARDVGRLQVRTAFDPGDGLIVRPWDPADAVYVLVVGQMPVYTLMGWLRGGDAKHSRYERAPNGRAPAFFVPAAALNPLATLPVGGRAGRMGA